MELINREYLAWPTIWKFHDSDDFIRGLVGPIGSGKSVGCVAELLKLMSEQEKGPDGIRRSRWAIIRNTYRELNDTTIRTFFDWFPQSLGKWKAADMEFVFESGDMHVEFLFRALDRPDDVKKLLSLELTGAWINEAKEIPRAILDMLQGRVGRFPSRRDGGPTWNGIIMDTNPPDTDHWWYRLFEEDRPDGWSVYHQPSGLSKEAENKVNLPPNYYERLQSGHDSAWIDVYVHGKYGYVKDGKPIFPEFSDTVHVLEDEPQIMRGVVYVGIDFGLTPAAVIAQKSATDQWIIYDELVTEDMGAVRFGELLGQLLKEKYRGHTIRAWGDPAGEQRSQVDERTPFQILRAQGIPAVKAPSNDFMLRVESVAKALTTLTMQAVPRLVISPRCRNLRKALAGGYKYRRVQVSGDERYHDKPDKGRYSHVAEALQYLMMGAGEGRELIKPDVDTTKFKVNKTIRPLRRMFR